MKLTPTLFREPRVRLEVILCWLSSNPYVVIHITLVICSHPSPIPCPRACLLAHRTHGLTLVRRDFHDTVNCCFLSFTWRINLRIASHIVWTTPSSNRQSPWRSARPPLATRSRKQRKHPLSKRAKTRLSSGPPADITNFGMVCWMSRPKVMRRNCEHTQHPSMGNS